MLNNPDGFTSILYLLIIFDNLIDLSLYIVMTSSICSSVKCSNFLFISIFISYFLCINII